MSRQLWWGHRIPAYFVRVQGEERLDKNDQANNDRWVVARTEADARTAAAKKLGKPEVFPHIHLLPLWRMIVIWSLIKMLGVMISMVRVFESCDVNLINHF